MINQAKVTKIAKTWQRITALRRRRISFPAIKNSKFESRSTSGKFVIYTNDRKRFVIPIAYISNDMIKQLLEMSEQVFGLPSEGPIRLPCDAVLMEYVVELIKRGQAKDIEKALLKSMEPSCYSFYSGFNHENTGQQCPVYAY